MITTAILTDPNRVHKSRITQVRQYDKDCLAVPKSDDDGAFKAGMYCKENW